MSAHRPEPPSDTSNGERLQRTLARAGFGSRRGAEQLIVEGRVAINGRVAELGVGVAHDGKTPTFDSLSAALTTALAPETRARATAVGTRGAEGSPSSTTRPAISRAAPASAAGITATTLRRADRAASANGVPCSPSSATAMATASAGDTLTGGSVRVLSST